MTTPFPIIKVQNIKTTLDGETLEPVYSMHVSIEQSRYDTVTPEEIGVAIMQEIKSI